jgi:hypothetical protein
MDRSDFVQPTANTANNTTNSTLSTATAPINCSVDSGDILQKLVDIPVGSMPIPHLMDTPIEEAKNILIQMSPDPNCEAEKRRIAGALENYWSQHIMRSSESRVDWPDLNCQFTCLNSSDPNCQLGCDQQRRYLMEESVRQRDLNMQEMRNFFSGIY